MVIKDDNGDIVATLSSGEDITACRQAEKVLRQSEEKFRAFLETAPVGIVRVNGDGRITLVNGKIEEMFGYDRAELIGQTVEILLPERLRNDHIKHRTGYLSNLRARPMGIGLELVARRKDGIEFPVEIGLSSIETKDGVLITSFITDITRRIKERTYEIERRQQVAEGLRDILAILNSNRAPNEILDVIVTQAAQLLHAGASAIYRLQSQIGLLTIRASQRLSSDYIAQADVSIGEGPIGQAVQNRRPVTISDLGHLLVKGDTKSRPGWQTQLAKGFRAILAAPLIIKEEVYGALVLYYPEPRDFSDEEIKLVVMFADQAALAIENARLRTQIEQAAVATERSRLAHDLHDSVTQTLFSASLIAEVLPRLWQRSPDEGSRRLEELRQLTRGALAEMRTLLLELLPSRLTAAKLSDLLHQLAEAIRGRARISVTLQVKGECTLPPDVQISLYRIAQEALNNVAKHAQASQATISLYCQPTRVELAICDNGRGFLLDGVEPDSLGLSIMRERAEAIGANLEVKSQVDQGTQVAVIWNDKKLTEDK